MREISIEKGKIILSDEVETLLERTATRFGTSGKADVPKKYIGKRLYVLVLKD